MNQDKYDGLGSQGYTGALNDRLRAMYIALGASGGALQDLEESFLLSKGVAPAALQDMWAAYLSGNMPPWSSLEAAAIATLRRLGGTLIGLPDDYGLVLGPELVVNGGFDTDTAWTKPTGWSISGGRAVATAVAAYTPITQSTAAARGRTFRVVVTVATVTAGSAYVQIGNFPDVGVGSTITTAGTYTYALTNPATSAFIEIYSGPSGFTGSIESISVKEIISAQHFIDSTGTQPVTAINDLVGLTLDRVGTVGPELVTNGDFSSAAGWTQGTGFSISGGVLNASSVAAYIGASRSISLTSGALYRVEYDLTVTAGSFAVYFSGGTNAVGLEYATSGRKSQVIRANAGNNTLVLSSQATGFTGSVDNISVKELTGNHASQPTTASKPLVANNAQGRKVLSFDGSNDSLSLGAVPFQMADDHCVVVGARCTSAASWPTLAAVSVNPATSATAALLFVDAGGFVSATWRNDAGSQVYQAAGLGLYQNNVPFVASARRVGSTVITRFNGGVEVSPGTTPPAGPATVTGGFIGGNGSGSPFPGTITAVAIMRGTVSDADLKLIERFIGSLQGQTL